MISDAVVTTCIFDRIKSCIMTKSTVSSLLLTVYLDCGVICFVLRQRRNLLDYGRSVSPIGFPKRGFVRTLLKTSTRYTDFLFKTSP